MRCRRQSQSVCRLRCLSPVHIVRDLARGGDEVSHFGALDARTSRPSPGRGVFGRVAVPAAHPEAASRRIVSRIGVQPLLCQSAFRPLRFSLPVRRPRPSPPAAQCPPANTRPRRTDDRPSAARRFSSSPLSRGSFSPSSGASRASRRARCQASVAGNCGNSRTNSRTSSRFVRPPVRHRLSRIVRAPVAIRPQSV